MVIALWLALRVQRGHCRAPVMCRHLFSGVGGLDGFSSYGFDECC